MPTQGRPSEPRAGRTYPVGSVRALLGTPAVSDQTRAVLEQRLAAAGRGAPRYFDEAAFRTLSAACARLLATSDATAGWIMEAIDARLADGMGNGWRYAEMPPDGEAYRLGSAALDGIARQRFGRLFAALDGGRQDTILALVQAGGARGGAGGAVAPARFFEELLTEAAESFYSHPVASEEIGYAGMADVPGWHALGLDRLEAREPRPTEMDGG